MTRGVAAFMSRFTWHDVIGKNNFLKLQVRTINRDYYLL